MRTLAKSVRAWILTQCNRNICRRGYRQRGNCDLEVPEPCWQRAAYGCNIGAYCGDVQREWRLQMCGGGAERERRCQGHFQILSLIPNVAHTGNCDTGCAQNEHAFEDRKESIHITYRVDQETVRVRLPPLGDEKIEVIKVSLGVHVPPINTKQLASR